MANPSPTENDRTQTKDKCKHHLGRQESDEQAMEVEKIFLHPNYNEKKNHKYDYDIALMKLKKSITYSDKVQPVCLPTQSYPPGTNCYVTGWGDLTDGGRSPWRLRQVQVPLVSTRECSRYNSGLTSRMLCAGFRSGGKDSCQGDSGGPLVCKNRSGFWDLAGVVSFGRGCALPRTYGVYANVVDLKDWVESTMKSN
ncbi:Transmembrane protease serine 6 [Exaiptasia diaphana]|nr:Transmembrane protease serine 6 [Exaiptasia diaphana]